MNDHIEAAAKLLCEDYEGTLWNDAESTEQSNRVPGMSMARLRGGRKHPRSVAKLPMPPKRKNEPEAAYGRRAHRWRVFLANEPRPDLWYTSEDEVREYREWSKKVFEDVGEDSYSDRARRSTSCGRSAVNQ